jgi:hypothetical protein
VYVHTIVVCDCSVLLNIIRQKPHVWLSYCTVLYFLNVLYYVSSYKLHIFKKSLTMPTTGLCTEWLQFSSLFLEVHMVSISVLMTWCEKVSTCDDLIDMALISSLIRFIHSSQLVRNNCNWIGGQADRLEDECRHAVYWQGCEWSNIMFLDPEGKEHLIYLPGKKLCV